MPEMFSAKEVQGASWLMQSQPQVQADNLPYSEFAFQVQGLNLPIGNVGDPWSKVD